MLQDKFSALLAQNTDALFAAIRGQAYEAHVHRNFQKLSGTQDMKRLRLDGTVEDCTFTFPELKKQRVFNEVKEVECSEYGVPRSRIYSAVDAVIKPNVALQMSVTPHHDYKVDGLKPVKGGLKLENGDPLHLIMVSPPDVAPFVTWQYLTRGNQRVKKPHGLVADIGLCQYCFSFPWN